MLIGFVIFLSGLIAVYLAVKGQDPRTVLMEMMR